MLARSKEIQDRKQLPVLECKIDDEQKWKDIAEEEYEVSSSYSPVDSYSPQFLKIDEAFG